MQLQAQIQAFQDLDAQIWVISNDPADKLEAMRQKLGLDFPTLMDPELEVVERFGVKHPEKDLPHPTAVVVDKSGTTSYVRIDENYAERPSTEELIEAVKATGG